VWSGIADALYRIRRADKRAGSVDYLMVKDVMETGFSGGTALREAGYHTLETEPEMELELRSSWRSYDEYLGNLNTKYRKATLGVREAIEKAGCIVEPLQDVSSQRHVLHKLYEQVAARAETRLLHQPPDYLPAMAERLGPDHFRITIVRRDDQIVGFVSTLRDKDSAVGYYLGLNYEANAEMPVYLRLLQAVVEDALQMGVRRVSFGRTALEPKARLGARPVSTHVWIRHRVPVLNSLVRHLLKAVPHEEAPDRNPFKGQG
jgi:predicted N-acyltransferase